jgi:CDP-diglyceride synthetase
MNTHSLRLICLFCLAIILFNQAWSLLIYWSAMLISIEVLNRSVSFTQDVYYRKYNLLFISYLVLVVIDRTRKFTFGETPDYWFNCFMHLAFGMIVCLKVKQYLRISNAQSTYNLIYIFLIFNVIGILNEVMQNALCHRALFLFIADSQKDVCMNVLGSLGFVAMVWKN